jgi:glycosyltransferase involved in cell wall biosynthesis
MIQRLKKIIKSIWYYFSCRHYREVKNSGLFDAEWYRDRIPGLQNSHQDPLVHYIDFGIHEGKSPSPLFKPTFYKNTYNQDLSEDPFLHYLKTGIHANHRPCPWFDPEFYRDQYRIPQGNRRAPLKHYLTEGLQQQLYPNSEVYELPVKPVISLIVPVYNVSALHLNNCVRSVLYQSYPHWEICLVDDCSTNEDVRRLLEKWAAVDSRIKVDFFVQNQGISRATNAAVSLASGKYIGFLDNDDELAEECLFTLVRNINIDAADLYYTDEDLIGEDGRQFSIFYKPDFNEELLLSHNYVTHFVLTEKKLFYDVEGLDSRFDGAQDFDLFLKLSEKAKKIIHIPAILYHWRASESSTSINHQQKQYADEAGRKAVVGALARRQISGEVLLTDWKFFYRIKKERQGDPLVSVVVLSRVKENFKEWLSQLLSLTNYLNTEFIVVVCNEEELKLIKQVTENSLRTVKFLLRTNEETLATHYNKAVRESSGEYLVFLNPWVQIQTGEWLEAMLEYAMAEKNGVVGGRIFPYQDNDLVKTVPDFKRQSDLYYARFLQRCSQHMNGLQCVQNVIALSWDLAMVERNSFLELDGFNENSLGNIFADSDLCLRMRERGYQNIYSPFAFGQWLKPEENLPLPAKSITAAERLYFQKKWWEVLRKGDPYYNYGVLSRKGIDKDQFQEWYSGLPSRVSGRSGDSR